MPGPYGGLWDGVYGQQHVLLNEPGSAERGIARLMAPQALVPQANIAVTLTGQTVGGAAAASISQVVSKKADGFNLGGKVDVAPTSVVGRVTTSADELRLDSQLLPKFAPTVYPPDISGNGGGGKTGTL